MNLENQVSNLELSKKLKELGVKQESLFYWRENGDLIAKALIGYVETSNDKSCLGCGSVDGSPEFYSFDDEEKKELISAFTVAELGEMLPEKWITQKDGKEWIAGDYADLSTDEFERANTEADARAKMLIYLLENKLVK